MSFLANIGGLLGLFMGFSAFSIIELFYFFTIRPCCNHLKSADKRNIIFKPFRLRRTRNSDNSTNMNSVVVHHIDWSFDSFEFLDLLRLMHKLLVKMNFAQASLQFNFSYSQSCSVDAFIVIGVLHFIIVLLIKLNWTNFKINEFFRWIRLFDENWINFLIILSNHVRNIYWIKYK